jgi:hypothetical protein
LNKYYLIGDEGIYSIYFAFCSNNFNDESFTENNFETTLRFTEGSIEFKNNATGYLSAEKYRRIKVIFKLKIHSSSS